MPIAAKCEAGRRSTLKHTAAIIRSRVGHALAALEIRFLKRFSAPLYPPIFIIGLPRSGSTLLYQVLLQAFRLSYFCNAAAKLPRSPALLTRFAKPSGILAPPCDYRSEYGVTHGLRAPAQAEAIWERWFLPNQHYTDAGVLSPDSIGQMQATVAAVESAVGGPFISKAMGHAVRIRSICEAFPAAIFIRTRRSHLDVAASILRGKREFLRDGNAWFSARPSNYESLIGIEPLTQVAKQIKALESDMARDLAAVGSDRVIEIEYEDLCLEPQAVVEAFAKFYRKQRGITLAPRNMIPAHFTPSRTNYLNATEVHDLRSALRDHDA